MATLTVTNISELVKFQENCYLSSPNLHFSLQEVKVFIQGSLAQVFLRIPTGRYMCPSISPDCHLLVLELVLVLSYHFISSGQTNTHRCSLYWAVLSRFSHVRLFVTLWTVAHQVPLSMGFSRQEYWSGLPFPSLGDLPNPRIELVFLMSPSLIDEFFTTPGKVLYHTTGVKMKVKQRGEGLLSVLCSVRDRGILNEGY